MTRKKSGCTGRVGPLRGEYYPSIDPHRTRLLNMTLIKGVEMDKLVLCPGKRVAGGTKKTRQQKGASVKQTS